MLRQCGSYDSYFFVNKFGCAACMSKKECGCKTFNNKSAATPQAPRLTSMYPPIYRVVYDLHEVWDSLPPRTALPVACCLFVPVSRTGPTACCIVPKRYSQVGAADSTRTRRKRVVCMLNQVFGQAWCYKGHLLQINELSRSAQQ